MLASSALAQERTHANAEETAGSDAPGAALEEARDRIARGEQAFRDEDFETALTEFEEAYRLIPAEHPARFLTLFNVARSHQRLFQYDQAIAYYRRYLDEGGEDAVDRSEVETILRTLEELLASIDVRSNVSAEIWIDGRRMGQAPCVVRVTAGRHAVELVADGYQSSQQELQIAARTERTLEFTLEPVPEPSDGLRPTAFWATAGASAAVLVAGAVVGGVALARRNNVDERLDDPLRRFEVDEGDRSSIRALSTTADTLFAVGGALAVTAIALGLLTDWTGGDDTRARISPVFGPSDFGVSVGGSL
ncbi:MAG: PEGA domain-containing protein [Myxococcota bacterium]